MRLIKVSIEVIFLTVLKYNKKTNIIILFLEKSILVLVSNK